MALPWWILLTIALAKPTVGWVIPSGGFYRPCVAQERMRLQGMRGASTAVPPHVRSHSVLPFGLGSTRKPPPAAASATTLSAHASATSLVRAVQRLTCTESSVLRLAVISGLLGILTQGILTQILYRLALGRRRDSTDTSHVDAYHTAGYTAHSLIAFLLMGSVSTMGVAGWWCNNGLGASAWARLVQSNETCRWMAAVLCGLLTLWDIPTSLSVPALRKPDVLLHHGVMAVTAATAAWVVPTSYVYFYFGIVELSSLPLILYDQLYQWTTNTTTLDAAISQSISTVKAPNPHLIPWRTAMQLLTVLSFTWIRAILFPLVTLGQFIPDVNAVLRLATLPPPRVVRALRYAKVASIGFTILQLYWFGSNIVVPIVSGMWKGRVATTAAVE